MRTKRERIHNTWKKIRRKLNLIKDKKWDMYFFGSEFTDQPHRLNKDRLEDRRKKNTNNKTKRHQYGNYQKTRNYKNSDQKKIDAGNYRGDET